MVIRHKTFTSAGGSWSYSIENTDILVQDIHNIYNTLSNNLKFANLIPSQVQFPVNQGRIESFYQPPSWAVKNYKKALFTYNKGLNIILKKLQNPNPNSLLIQSSTADDLGEWVSQYAPEYNYTVAHATTKHISFLQLETMSQSLFQGLF